MDRRSTLIAVAIVALTFATVPTVASAAGQGGGVVGPVVGHATRADVSPALRDMKPLPPKFAQGFQVEVMNHTRPGNRPNPPGHEPSNRQSSDRPDATAAATPLPTLNFEGLSDDDNSAVVGGRIVPPDTNGDIGPNHYVQYINLIWAVWDITRDVSGAPTGATLALGPLAGNTFWNGFGGVCETNNDGDPVVTYDHLADRWVVSQFSINQGTQCFAVSTSPDPTGTYYRYELVVSPGEQNDYPKQGMMPDAYYLSLRDFPSNDGTFAGFVAIDRAALLAGPDGGPVTFVKFSLPCATGDCPDGVQPPHLEGPAPAAGTPGYFTRFWDDQFDGPLTGTDGVRIWELDPDFATPANSTFTELAIVPLPDYDSAVCGFFQRNCIPVPKKGGGSALDSADELQMFRAQYRSFSGHDSLVINTTVDADGNDTAGILWAELRNSGSGWTAYQSGVYAPADGENRWMGSAAMNGFGDIALGYSLASSGTFPSVRYTTRQSIDALGTLPGGEEEIIAGTGTQTQANRWGDYSSMSVDPVDDCTFWYTQEYYQNTNSFDFKTRIAAFSGPCAVPAVCGDASCDAGENECNCPADCGAPPGSETGLCTDGNDNDCDGDVDCNDADCAADAACICVAEGDSCSTDADCCSNNCSGGKPSTRVCLP